MLLLSPLLACDELTGAPLYPSSQATLPTGGVVLIGHPDPDVSLKNSSEEPTLLDLGRWTGLPMELPDGDYYVVFQGVERLITVDSALHPGPLEGEVGLVESSTHVEDYDEDGCENGRYAWVEATLALPATDGFGWSALVRDSVSGRSFGYLELAPFIDVERDATLVLPLGEEEEVCLRLTVYNPLLEEEGDFELDCVPLPEDEEAAPCGCASGPSAGGLLVLLGLLVQRRRIANSPARARTEPGSTGLPQARRASGST